MRPFTYFYSTSVKAYYFVRQNGRSPLEQYLTTINDLRELAAVEKTIERLIAILGHPPFPIAKHVEHKIWEFRTRFGNRVFYFLQDGTDIILLDGFTKKQNRIPLRILERVRMLYQEYQLTKHRKPY